MKIDTNKAILVVVLLLLLHNTVFAFVMGMTDPISGKATMALASIHFCVGKNVALTFSNPDASLPTFTTNFTANITALFINPNGSNYVDIYYFTLDKPKTYLGRDYYDGNDQFNITVPVDDMPDGNCNYALETWAQGACTFTVAVSHFFSVNNNDTEPIWDEFYNNITTNFSTFTTWGNLSKATIGIPDIGKMEYQETVNFDDTNLSDLIEIEPKKISVTTNLRRFPCGNNKLVHMTFYNASFIDPIVYKNNEVCSDCMNSLNVTSNSVTFNTTIAGTDLEPTSVYEIVEDGGVNLTIELDPNLQDVDLNWTAQPLASYYEIYYGSNVTELYYGDPNNQTAKVTNYHQTFWRDTTANQVKERYYYIVAVKGGAKARSPQTGAKFDIYVNPGLNLISLPTETKNMSLNEVVIPLDEGTANEKNRITRYGTTFQRSDYYGPTWKWWGDFENLDLDVGYYYYPSPAKFNISVVGLVNGSNRTVKIKQGLNIIGFASFLPRKLNDILNPGDSNYGDTITRYTVTWQRVDYYGDTWKWWGDFEKLDPGYGYWFYPVAQSYDWNYTRI